jgi:hypothetical protein
MTLSGLAFLALWNDVDSDVEADYERWHTLEHVPERVGIPGFLAGRRYRSDAAGQPRYFTLYEVSDTGVFDSAAYRDVIEHPTSWSAVMRPRLRNVARATCETVSSTGALADDASTQCAAIACARFTCTTADGPHVDALLAACASLPGVRAAHLGQTRDSVPQAFQQWTRRDAPSHVVLLEGADENTLRDAQAALAAAIGTHGHAREPAIIDTFTQVFRIAHAQVDASLRRDAARAPSPASFPFDATSGHP